MCSSSTKYDEIVQERESVEKTTFSIAFINNRGKKFNMMH